ncbi:MAG: DMT family transporter [Anaerolineales bacterium]|nr:DMT family transporter [Anaerolineales bacterium]
MKRNNLAVFHALLAVLIWSTVAAAFKLALRRLDHLQLLLFATITSLVFYFLVIVIRKKLPLLKAATPKEYLRSALMGFLNPFLYYVVLFRAYSLLPAQQAQALNYTWPVMLVLLSIPLLKQKIGGRSIIAILVSFAGVVVVSTQGNLESFRQVNLEGVLLALGSAVIWALYWVFEQRDERDAVLRFFQYFSFGFIYILIATLLFSRLILPDLPALGGAVYVGLFEMGVTFVVWALALRLAEQPAQVINLIYLMPFISLFFINLVAGERITPATVVGLVVIVVGVGIQRYNPKAV